MDEGRKRVLLIAASILAARKLAQYEPGARVPATICAIAFIDRRRPQCLRVTQAEQLRSPQVQRIEARYTRPALRHRVRIVEGVVVQKIVRREHPPVTVVVESIGALIVPQSFVLGGGREFVRAYVWLRYILQQIPGRGRPFTLRDNVAIRKDAVALAHGWHRNIARVHTLC
jgi:hypothetical protein